MKLEAFAAHVFDQHRKLKLASTSDFHDVSRFGVCDFDADVAEDFFVQTIAKVTTGEILAIFPCVRRSVHAETHSEHWLINF